MNNNWNINNRGRKNWGGSWRGGRGRDANRGSWSRNSYSDQRMPYPNQRGGFRGRNRNRGGNSYQGNIKSYRDPPSKRLSEEEIGVTEYLSDHKGFNGIIKCRYSDFQVSEINENGEIAKLTDMSPPMPPMEDTIKEDEDLLLSKYNLEILPLDTWDRINELVVNQHPVNEIVEIDVTGMTKEERTKIHDAVKKAFGISVVGSTVTVDDKKFVKFEKFRKGVRRDNRVKWVWPAEYVYFIVHKENCDTMEAASRITEKLKLNLKPSMLGYAGTKDRRAKTSQWFSLRKVDPRRIAAAAKDVRDVYVGNFSFSPINLKLGMLRGNRFRIALRNVTAPDDVVEEACQRLREFGFINYYGLQRFGSRPDVPTYEIGRLLLQANYRQAIQHIVEDDELRPMGGRTGGGMRFRRALSTNPRDMIGALDQLARNQRMLYLHAYQSLVWNRCASERLRRFGSKPAAGDLVPLHADPSEYERDEESDDEDKEEKTKEESVTDENAAEGVDEKIAADCEVKEENKGEKPEDNKEGKPEKKVQTKNVPKPKVPMKVLTEEDVVSGRYTIFDIVLPVPGYNIEYPPNMVDYYKELLEKDNLKLEMRHKNKPYSLSGAYRALCVRPGGLQWRGVQYRHPNCDLQLSDLQQLQGRTEEDTGILQDGPYKALLLTMTLPASSYATMALRELMKVDTANDSQALQNDYHKKPLAGTTGTTVEAEKPRDDSQEADKSLAETTGATPDEEQSPDNPQEGSGIEEARDEKTTGTAPEIEESGNNKKASGAENSTEEESVSTQENTPLDSSCKTDAEKESEMSVRSEAQSESRAEKRKMEGDTLEECKKSKQDPSDSDVNRGE